LHEKPDKFSNMKKDKVINVEKKEGEEQDSSSSSSTWKGPRPAPSEVPHSTRARPAEEGIQDPGAPGEEVKYSFQQ
jgi:hypothetical protein